MQKWTPSQHRKFRRTMAAKRRAAKLAKSTNGKGELTVYVPSPAQIPQDVIASAAGYCFHALEEFARRSRVPAADLTERVAEILLHSQSR